MVATVSFQLFISLIMDEPDHNGGGVGKLAFEMHEIVGLAALGIILVHWLWSITNEADGGLKHLFPWFGSARQQVMADMKEVFKGSLPEGGKGGLSGLIHGLGLLAVTGIAVTGGAVFILYPEVGNPGDLVEGVMELHEAMAGLVWAYWLGHGGMAFLHYAMGHDTLNNMFSLRSKKKLEASHGAKSIVH
jgi:cytochrome b561